MYPSNSYLLSHCHVPDHINYHDGPYFPLYSKIISSKEVWVGEKNSRACSPVKSVGF